MSPMIETPAVQQALSLAQTLWTPTAIGSEKLLEYQARAKALHRGSRTAARRKKAVYADARYTKRREARTASKS